MTKYIYLLLLGWVLLLSSCYYSHPNQMDHWTASDNESIDSVNFQITHHYWTGYNFKTVDSLVLQPNLPDKEMKLLAADVVAPHPIIIPEGTSIVVTDISYAPAAHNDSVWVKVASDQFTQGWLNEKSLLEKSTPDDPISQFIHNFSDKRTLIFVACLLAFLLTTATYFIIRRKQLNTIIRYLVHTSGLFSFSERQRGEVSFYPLLLCIVVAVTTTIYVSIQQFVPGTWVEYYFNPTLNPFHPELPLILAIFLCWVWLMAIMTLAVFLDFIKRKYLAQALLSFVAVLCVCIFIYLLFTLTVPIYLGYLLLLLYIGYSIYRYVRRARSPRYYCGHCGTPLSHLDKCPHCGAINQ